MKFRHFAVLAGSALLLSACGSKDAGAPAADEPAADSAAATAAAPANPAPAAFAQCVSCHAVEPGKIGIGPSLAGMVGRKAGSDAGYTYSDALKASGLTWDEATLDKWLQGSMQMVPGTKMTFAGVSDAAARAEIIAYMKTL